MKTEMFYSEKTRELLLEIDKTEQAMPLVENEKVQELREHKAEFYYRQIVSIIKQLNKEIENSGRKLFLKDEIRIEDLKNRLLKNCPAEYQPSVDVEQENNSFRDL